jgi:hypothetical protein
VISDTESGRERISNAGASPIDFHLTALTTRIEHVDGLLGEVRADIGELRNGNRRLFISGITAAVLLAGVFVSGWLILLGKVDDLKTAISALQVTTQKISDTVRYDLAAARQQSPSTPKPDPRSRQP